MNGASRRSSVARRLHVLAIRSGLELRAMEISAAALLRRRIPAQRSPALLVADARRLHVLAIRSGLELRAMEISAAALLRRRIPAQRSPALLVAAGVLLTGIGLGQLTAQAAEPTVGLAAEPTVGLAVASRPSPASASQPSPAGPAGAAQTAAAPVVAPPQPAEPAPEVFTAAPGPGPLTVPAPAAAAAATGLQIPELGLDVDLQPLDLDGNGELAPPASASEAGWYTGSAAPGEIGPAVVVGHVDSRSGPGVFFRLKDLNAGDEITLRRSDGRAVVYRVGMVEFFAKDAFPTDRVYGPTAASEVRLITCGGVFDYRTRHYRDNVVAYATAVA